MGDGASGHMDGADVDEGRRRAIKMLGAAGVAAASPVASGCASLDMMYEQQVREKIQSDIKGLSAAETIDYFLTEQRSFDDAPYLTGFTTEVETAADGYTVHTTIDSDIVFVEDCEAINDTHVELDAADTAVDYDNFTGRDMAECNGGLAYTDTAGDADYLIAEDRDDLVQGLDSALWTVLKTQYRVTQGTAGDRPVARGQFIDVDDQQAALDGRQPDSYTVAVRGDGGSIYTVIDGDSMPGIHEDLDTPWAQDYTPVQERTQVRRS